jgi:hypothetical protein
VPTVRWSLSWDPSLATNLLSFNQILSKNFSVSDPSSNKQRRGHTGVGGLRMRVLVVFAILAAFLPLGGCFHHTQAVSVEPLSTPSIK